MTLVVLILTFVAGFQYVKSQETVEYDLSDGVIRICFTRTDDDACPPDHQIEPCEAPYEKVRCVPCPSGLRQCDKSTSALLTKCYDPITLCPADDNVVMVVNHTAGGCKILCRCNEAQGYTGSDPLHCDYNKFPCQPTHHRVGGECFPCPDGYLNPWDDGVDRCVEKTSTTTPLPVYLEGKMSISESTTSKPRTDSTLQTVQLMDTSSKDVVTKNTDETAVNNDFNINKINENSSDTIQWVWIVIVIVIICLLVALFFYFCCYQQGKADDIEALQLEATSDRATRYSTTGAGATEDSTKGAGATEDSTTGAGATEDSTTGAGATEDSTTGAGATEDSITGAGATEDSTTDPREREESIPLLTNASGGEESVGTSLGSFIQTTAGGHDFRTKLQASKPLSTVPLAASTSSQSVAQASKSSICSCQCEVWDVCDDKLYRLIKPDFCRVVDPTQLLLFLNCSLVVDERITEIQESKGRSVAAHQLLFRLVKQQEDWVGVLCNALRSKDLKLEHLADTIEEKQRQLSRQGELYSGPEAIVCQEVGSREGDTSFSSLQRKQQTHVKEVD